MGRRRERPGNSARQRGGPEPRLRRLSRAERQRVYLRRRIIALLVLAAVILVILVLAGLIALPLVGAKPSGVQAEKEAQSLDVSPSASKMAASSGASGVKPVKPTQGKPSEKAAGKPLDVLVLGVDKRPAGSTVEGSRADTVMLARVFPDTGDVKMLSIPRDLFVEIKPGEKDRINAAYSYGGVSQATATVERLTGITIDRHAVVDFQGFEDLVNAVDGVTVDTNAYGAMPRGWHMEGRQTLDGHRALLYSRYRGTPGGGDLDRIARQQQVVNALHDKVMSWNSLLKLPGMVRVARDNVETDSGFVESLSLGRSVLRDGGNIQAVQLKGDPTTTPDGRMVLMPDREDNERLVRDFRQPGV